MDDYEQQKRFEKRINMFGNLLTVFLIGFALYCIYIYAAWDIERKNAVIEMATELREMKEIFLEMKRNGVYEK